MAYQLDEHDVIMLRRCAEACRNLNANADADWFRWVPEHLDQMAYRATLSSEAGATP